jgi:hypothetical protein
VRKISLQPGFDPVTVLPITRRYTDRAIADHENKYIDMEKRLFQKTKVITFICAVNLFYSLP